VGIEKQGGFEGRLRVSVAVMRPLRLGIVGAGFIADVIANSIREAESVVLAAVASRRVETAQALAAKHGGVRVFGTWSELVASDEVDAVYIATPTVAREEIAIAAAAKGKHVLAEKPFRDLASLRRITSACRAAGVAFMDATHFSHHPRTTAIRAQMAERIGPVEAIYTSFFFPSADRNNIRLQPDKEPTGAIGDMAWYSMRAVAEFTPETATLVGAHGFARKDAVTGGFLRGAGVVQLSDGCTSTWDAGYTVGACLMDLQLMGQKGVIQLDDFVLDWVGGFLIPEPGHQVGFTFKAGLAGPSGFERVVTPAFRRQSVQMLEDFARLASEPRGAEVDASIRLSERTQGLVDAVFGSLTVTV
jgi:predicted dehydrogenase